MYDQKSPYARVRHTWSWSARNSSRRPARSHSRRSEYESDASARSATAETCSRRAEERLRPVQAPVPRAAHQRRPRAGADTTPTTGSPPSSRASSVAQTGTPRTKFFVPSIGSTTHWRLPWPVGPNSSPTTASRGRVRRSWVRTSSSASLSASLTGVRSGLVSTRRSAAWNRDVVTLSTMSAMTWASRRSSSYTAWLLSSSRLDHGFVSGLSGRTVPPYRHAHVRHDLGPACARPRRARRRGAASADVAGDDRDRGAAALAAARARGRARRRRRRGDRTRGEAVGGAPAGAAAAVRPVRRTRPQPGGTLGAVRRPGRVRGGGAGVGHPAVPEDRPARRRRGAGRRSRWRVVDLRDRGVRSPRRLGRHGQEHQGPVGRLNVRAGGHPRGAGTFGARSPRKAARISAAKISGSSQAAKWPPLAASEK